MARVLIAGESWMTTSTHTKGVDEFSVHSYTEGVGPLRDALEASGHTVVHMPGHLVPTQFPSSLAELAEFDVIVLSDIGANSIQLAPSVFDGARPGVDRLAVLADWVRGGGALLMIGGYLSFSGFQARAAFRNTAIAEVLPVQMLPEDDRVEQPGGVVAVPVADEQVSEAGRVVLAGVPEGEWPVLLGYNRTVPLPDADVLATVGQDPLIVLREVGAGRSAVFTSDCSPHWAPPEFCEQWAGYRAVFDGLVTWLAAA